MPGSIPQHEHPTASLSQTVALLDQRVDRLEAERHNSQERSRDRDRDDRTLREAFLELRTEVRTVARMVKIAIALGAAGWVTQFLTTTLGGRS